MKDALLSALVAVASVAGLYLVMALAAEVDVTPEPTTRAMEVRLP